MFPIRLGLMVSGLLAVSVVTGGCEPKPDILGVLDRAVVLRTESPRLSLELTEPTTEQRAVLEKLAGLGYVIDVSAYAPLPPSVLTADLAYLADAVAKVNMPSQAKVEHWSLIPESILVGSSIDPTSGDLVDHEIGPDGTFVAPRDGHRLPNFPYRQAVIRNEGWSPLPIVFLPRFADLAASIGADAIETEAAENDTIERVVATSELWSAAMYFLPQSWRLVSYRYAMPNQLADFPLIYPPQTQKPRGPTSASIGKIIGRPDDNKWETGFLPSARKIEKRLSSGEALGVVMTGELTPGLWAFAAWEPGDAEGRATRQGFAVPLLDGNGAMRGTSAFDVTSVRGSAFENPVLDVPEGLSWGRHVLYKLPRPMALAWYGMTDEMRARATREERIVALIASDEMLVPSVQAFVKAETWGPFAEDVVLTANPTREQLASGAVRALAISASIKPDDLLRLLAAMAGHDPIEPDADGSGW